MLGNDVTMGRDTARAFGTRKYISAMHREQTRYVLEAMICEEPVRLTRPWTGKGGFIEELGIS